MDSYGPISCHCCHWCCPFVAVEFFHVSDEKIWPQTAKQPFFLKSHLTKWLLVSLGRDSQLDTELILVDTSCWHWTALRPDVTAWAIWAARGARRDAAQAGIAQAVTPGRPPAAGGCWHWHWDTLYTSNCYNCPGQSHTISPKNATAGPGAVAG